MDKILFYITEQLEDAKFAIPLDITTESVIDYKKKKSYLKSSTQEECKNYNLWNLRKKPRKTTFNLTNFNLKII